MVKLLNQRSKIQILLLCIMLPLFLGSWVDGSSIDVYTGTIQYADTNGYNVANLSGSISFYLSSYDDLALNESGYLVSAAPSVISGRLLTSQGAEFPCRFSAFSGFQIEQSYYYNGTYERTTWIDYNLTPDTLPLQLSVPELSIVAVVFVLFILVAIIIIGRGVIL